MISRSFSPQARVNQVFHAACKHILPILLILIFLTSVSAPDALAQYIQQGSKIVGTGATGAASQGLSVAISADGTTAIAGGHYDNGYKGAVWVYSRGANQWTQQGGKLVPSGESGSPLLGAAVAISSDGNTIIAGGYNDNGQVGAAWIYKRTGGVWSQQGNKLVGTGAVGTAAQGISVAISGDGNTAIVGGQDDNSTTGAAWIFTRTGGVWSQQGSKLVGTGASGAARQGNSVAISADGNTAVVGGYADENSAYGAVWIFTRSAGVWTQQGSKLIGTGAAGFSSQGTSVSISSDGNTVAVGGPGNDSSIGATWIFTRSAGAWTQQGSKLVGSGVAGTVASQGNGISLSADGNSLLVGGFLDNNYLGAAWIFTRSGNVWTQLGPKIIANDATGTNPHFGYSVSLSSDGSQALVGGYFDNGSTGAAWLYLKAQPEIASANDLPLDQGGTVMVNWNKSGADFPTSTTVSSYWVWRGIRSAFLPPNARILNRKDYAAINRAQTDDRVFMNGERSDFPMSGEIYWQYIASVPSHALTHYSYPCPSLADSTEGGIPWRYFFITAATADPDVYWDSPVDSGYSVDNLSPSAVTSIAATVLPGSSVNIHWNPNVRDPDVSYFEIHRSTSPGFTPTPATRIAQTSDTSFVDNSPTQEAMNFYRVITTDIHGNQSPTSPQASASLVTLPSAPTSLVATLINSSSIDVSWQDNASNEDGYTIGRKSGEFGTYEFLVTLGAGIVSHSDIGLTDGTRYYYRVNSFNVAGNSDYSNESNGTTPMTAPSGLNAVKSSEARVDLNWSDNSASESGYRIERKTGAGGEFGEIAVVGSGVVTYGDVDVATGYVYYYRVRGSNDVTNSGYSNEVAVAVSATRQYPMTDKWNLVSVPLVVEDFALSAVFPSSVSDASAYDSESGYETRSALTIGEGYWVKFDGAQSVSITGIIATESVIEVAEGWNLIGSIGIPFLVAEIKAMPEGMTTSKLYEYAEKYVVADTIQPGKGYWVKVDRAGQLILGLDTMKAAGYRITIRDRGELPPATPERKSNNSSGVE